MPNENPFNTFMTQTPQDRYADRAAVLRDSIERDREDVARLETKLQKTHEKRKAVQAGLKYWQDMMTLQGDYVVLEDGNGQAERVAEKGGKAKEKFDSAIWEEDEDEDEESSRGRKRV